MVVALPLRSYALPRIASVAGIDAMLLVGLVGLAGAVRWPYLLLSPQFPSVGGTVLRALDVVDGRFVPLADQAPYLGALFIYLLAAVYKLAGPSVEATLLVPWALGSLTVVPTYLLGRELGGRVVGLLAAALLATSGAHTVVSSHVPLSHSLTPLLSTATLWLLARAVNTERGPVPPALFLAGLAAGLSLQTHPTVAPLLAGAALAAVVRRPTWLRTWRAYVALAFVLLGYGGLLIHHVQTRFEIVSDVQGKQARYLDADEDVGESPERGVYLNNLGQLSVSLARLASGAIDVRDSTGDYLRDPRVLAHPALAAVGLASAPAGVSLLLALAPAVFLPPILSGKYQPILDGRYLMPLIPVMFVLIGLAFAMVLARVGRLPAGPRHAAVVIAIVAAVLLVTHPLATLAHFYRETQEDGFGNAVYLRTLGQIRAARSEAEPVVLDARLAEVKSAGGGSAGASFGWLLAVSRIPYDIWRDGDDPDLLVGRLAVLHRATAERLGDRLGTATLDGRRPNGRDRQSYRAYRVPAP